MKVKIDEKQIKKLMKSLDLTREEAIQLKKDDAITTDKTGATAEQKEDVKIKNYVATEKTKSRTRKPTPPNPTKVELIKTLFNWLITQEDVQNVQIVNVQGEVTFTKNGLDFSLNLVKHNQKKTK